jgi:hypothetical protein
MRRLPSHTRPTRNAGAALGIALALAAGLVAIAPAASVAPEPAASTRSLVLAPGHTRLSLRVEHVPEHETPSVSVWWYLAPRGGHVFHLAAVTPTRALDPDVTYATATVDPPARHFSYRVCLNPPWELAKAAAAPRGACPEHGATAHTLEYEGEGEGTPVAAYPTTGAIDAAAHFLDGRAGRTSLAVIDSRGHLSGVREHGRFETASVVKVMMLVAYLQMLESEHRGLDSYDRSLLYPMIHISDNEAASTVFGIVGGDALARVARASGMSDYAPGIGWWAYTDTSAADQARFFAALEQLIPRQFYGYARGLLSGIEPSQSWGIPPVARPAWRVFFKTGALPSQGLFNEVARLERGGVTFTVAVFTDGDPSMAYGEETIQGVASALLGHTP